MSPDNRQHRGAHPADKQLFDAGQLPALRRAVSDLSWLLSRGYTMKASLKIVGDRYGLRERQRLAAGRAACSDASRDRRIDNCLPIPKVRNEDMVIDGFNLIITIEAALGGGVLLLCRDGCIRDLSSVHGSYRSVIETERAILLIGEALQKLEPKSAKWLLDKPVSNSGRLARKIKDLGVERNWPWSVEVVFNPDAEILSSGQPAVTSDSSILDRTVKWVNFNCYLIKQYLPGSWVVDLRA